MNKLWTRDFTILTAGSVVSIFGNTLSGFAINLIVLDYSNSIFLFVLYMVIFNLPKIIAPIIAGPFLDSFSRRKTIYTLDFLSTAIFITLFIILRGGFFNYGVFLVISLTLGTIDSIYMVAYESLYPVLVSEGNFRKAYSVSSVVLPLSFVMVPVATFVYERFGVGPIFAVSAAAFLTAACFETQIRVDETHLRTKTDRYDFSEFKTSFYEGLEYIKGEKGLLIVTAYFFMTMFATASTNLILPYFRNTEALGVMLFSLVTSCGVFGRIVGGAVQYRLDYPKDKKFMIALIVYISICVLESVLLFTPVVMMAIISFIVGLLGVTSYNIRISATQSYIPDEKRARFNGTFQMFMNSGMIIGQLIAGALADHFPIRAVIVSFFSINLIAAIGIMWRGRNHVKLIYNRVV